MPMPFSGLGNFGAAGMFAGAITCDFDKRAAKAGFDSAAKFWRSNRRVRVLGGKHGMENPTEEF